MTDPAGQDSVLTARASDGTVYDVHGPIDAPAIALIHGLGLCRHLWADHLPAFAEHFRVINYDLFGHGDSAPLSTEGSLQLYATQLVDLLDELQIEQAGVVGFSIGGMINRRFAIDYPERLAALAVLSSPHDRGPDGQQAVEDRATNVREHGPLSTMDAALARWFTPASLASHPERAELVRSWRVKAHPESYAQATWVLANGVPELINPQPPLTAPTLVMTCENDTGSTPAMSHTIAAEIAGAQTVIVPDLQHLGLMEDPPAFTDPIIAFLNHIQN